MALTPYSEATNIIGSLGTDPEDRPDLDDQGLKDKFDENATNFKGYINDTHIPEVEAELGTKATTASVALKSDKYLTFETITASKIFDLTDIDVIQMCSHAATPINLTIPPQSDVVWPDGAFLPAKWHGVAQVAFVAGSGVTINPSTKLKINAAGDYVGALRTAENVWDLIGPTKA